MWTAVEINLVTFTVYKWQSIKLLWNKGKFWDFSILMMTSKTCRVCSVFWLFCSAATRNKICYQTKNFQACFQALSGKVLRSFKIFSGYFTLANLLQQFLMKPLVLKVTFWSRDHAATNLLILRKWFLKN